MRASRSRSALRRARLLVRAQRVVKRADPSTSLVRRLHAFHGRAHTVSTAEGYCAPPPLRPSSSAASPAHGGHRGEHGDASIPQARHPQLAELAQDRARPHKAAGARPRRFSLSVFTGFAPAWPPSGFGEPRFPRARGCRPRHPARRAPLRPSQIRAADASCPAERATQRRTSWRTKDSISAARWLVTAAIAASGGMRRRMAQAGAAVCIWGTHEEQERRGPQAAGEPRRQGPGAPVRRQRRGRGWTAASPKRSKRRRVDAFFANAGVSGRAARPAASLKCPRPNGGVWMSGEPSTALFQPARGGAAHGRKSAAAARSSSTASLAPAWRGAPASTTPPPRARSWR